VELHVRRYASRKRETPRRKAVASGCRRVALAANVRLHGAARPWPLNATCTGRNFVIDQMKQVLYIPKLKTIIKIVQITSQGFGQIDAL
jgi:hypothetical protein